MDSELSGRAGKGFRVLSEPLRPETLRLRETLEPQKAVGQNNEPHRSPS